MKKAKLAIAMIALGTAALAHGGVENKDVMARMMVMETIGDQMKLVGAMAKGQMAFDANAANSALNEIAAQSAQIVSMFEVRAEDPKSEALPVIWEDWETFSSRATDAEHAAEKLAGTIQSEADLGAALGQLGEPCKACHSQFRK